MVDAEEETLLYGVVGVTVLNGAPSVIDCGLPDIDVVLP